MTANRINPALRSDLKTVRHRSGSPMSRLAICQAKDAAQAAFSRAISVSNAKRNCAASSSGNQFVICGKIVR